MSPVTKPLNGIKVLDFTRLYAGPFCTMLLGDLGADVVKVEAPDGDPIRRQGPPFFKGLGMSFLAVNRNKRSIVIDTKAIEGRKIARELCLRADVIVENFRPGVMARMGLGYTAIARENPAVIYAAMSGMGEDGPSAAKGAFDLTVQAEGGYMSITGERGRPPIKLGTSAFDLICGQYAMGAIVTSLFARERTGKGERIETSLLESEVSFLVDAAMEYLLTGHNREKWGSEHAALVPYKAFATADGWLIIGAGTQNLFVAFLEVLGRSDLLQDPRFVTVEARVANRDFVHQTLDAEVKQHATAELQKALEQARVPCAAVADMEHVFSNPQVLHRGMRQQVRHPLYGTIPVLGPAVKYAGFDVTADWTAPPTVGEHQDDILRDWIGMDPSSVAREKADQRR